MPIRGNDLTLAVDDGVLWFSRRGERPSRVDGDPKSALGYPWFYSSDEVHIAATPGSSDLIVAAFDRCERMGIPLWLCGPRTVSGPRPWLRPFDLVAKMSSFVAAEGFPPASVGGPHRMTPLERPIYAAAAAVESGGDPSREFASLEDHPLLRSLGYAAGIRTDCVCRIVSRVRDPRWFVNPAKPNAMSPLYAHFGLGGRSLGSRRVDLIADCLHGTMMSAVADNVDPRRTVFLRHFLFGKAVREAESAQLSTSRFFLRYLRAVWLAILNPDNPDFLSFDHLFESAFTHGSPGEDGYARDDLALEAAGELREWVLNNVNQT